MLIVVNKYNQHLYLKEMVSNHQLRKRVFSDTLGWDLNIIDGMEFDQFDTPDAYHILHVNNLGQVDGSVRLLPTMNPYLLGDVFSYLLDGKEVPRSSEIWEATRFCVDPYMPPNNISSILLIGVYELGKALGIEKYLSVIDVRLERKIKSCGWTPSRLGSVHTIPDGRIVSNCLSVEEPYYRQMIKKTGICCVPVLRNLDEVLEREFLKEVA